MNTKQIDTITAQYQPIGDGDYEFTGVVPEESVFPLGRIVVNRTVAEEVKPELITRALYQYRIGNWGAVPSAVDDLNRQGLLFGGPIIGWYWLGKEPTPVVLVTRGNPPVTRVTIW